MKTYMTANSLKANFKSVTVYFAILLFIIPVFCFSQVDTAAMKRKQMRQVEQIKQAQNKALQQMKDMGINIDPNKKMTKEEANKLKQQLLGKADEMKKKLPGKPTEQNKNIEIKIPNSAEVLQVANRFYTRSYKQLNAIEKSQFDVDYKEAEKIKKKILMNVALPSIFSRINLVAFTTWSFIVEDDICIISLTSS